MHCQAAQMDFFDLIHFISKTIPKNSNIVHYSYIVIDNSNPNYCSFNNKRVCPADSNYVCASTSSSPRSVGICI